jgi:hypothetical protein
VSGVPLDWHAVSCVSGVPLDWRAVSGVSVVPLDWHAVSGVSGVPLDWPFGLLSPIYKKSLKMPKGGNQNP